MDGRSRRSCHQAEEAIGGEGESVGRRARGERSFSEQAKGIEGRVQHGEIQALGKRQAAGGVVERKGHRDPNVAHANAAHPGEPRGGEARLRPADRAAADQSERGLRYHSQIAGGPRADSGPPAAGADGTAEADGGAVCPDARERERPEDAAGPEARRGAGVAK